MDNPRHVIIVHHAPLVAEAVAVTLSMLGFTVHPAATYRDARALLKALNTDLHAVVAHADMPKEPYPGTLLRMVRALHPEAAMVVISGRSRRDIGRLPAEAVLLREPFDRSELMAMMTIAAEDRETERALLAL